MYVLRIFNSALKLIKEITGGYDDLLEIYDDEYSRGEFFFQLRRK